MRIVAIAELKDKVSEIVAAAEAGEEITITRHGREVVRMVGLDRNRLARQRAAVDAASALGQEIKARHGSISMAEVRQWIEEGRP